MNRFPFFSKVAKAHVCVLGTCMLLAAQQLSFEDFRRQRDISHQSAVEACSVNSYAAALNEALSITETGLAGNVTWAITEFPPAYNGSKSGMGSVVTNTYNAPGNYTLVFTGTASAPDGGSASTSATCVKTIYAFDNATGFSGVDSYNIPFGITGPGFWAYSTPGQRVHTGLKNSSCGLDFSLTPIAQVTNPGNTTVFHLPSKIHVAEFLVGFAMTGVQVSFNTTADGKGVASYISQVGGACQSCFVTANDGSFTPRAKVIGADCPGASGGRVATKIRIYSPEGLNGLKVSSSLPNGSYILYMGAK